MWPHFFKCGSTNTAANAASECTSLQCGRTFSSAEVRLSVGARLFWRIASMWPHFFKCGSFPMEGDSIHAGASFNVAALFQVRK